MRKIQCLVLLALAIACVRETAIAQDRDRDLVTSQGNAAVVIPIADRVDVNHASLEELLRLPGLTPSWAGRIVRFRPYRSKQDLLDKGIVNSQVYDHIRPYVIAHRDRH
jgi:DNA uptake protein ComE-like DNA-binding protein